MAVAAKAARVVEGREGAPTTGCTGQIGHHSPLGHCWIVADKLRCRVRRGAVRVVVGLVVVAEEKWT